MKPVIYDRKPVICELEKDKQYAWCSCGMSKTQPFCDGTHRGTEFKPIKFIAEESGKKAFCQCKHTNTPPYCDGTHLKLPQETTSIETANKNSDINPIEPKLKEIQALAEGLDKIGSSGEVGSMGVPASKLPSWDDIQILTAQLAVKPLATDAPVNTEFIIGPNAEKPLKLDIPILVSDMSFGALSREAKISLSKGAELTGTAICSGEGGMLEEEALRNNRYMFEFAPSIASNANSIQVYSKKILKYAKAIHFKVGQGAKTGTGGHFPADKLTKEIAEVRGIPMGKTTYSPSTFTDLTTPEDYKRLFGYLRGVSGGIPIGFKMGAQHIEKDIDFVVQTGADYIILDGRGGGTGGSPLLFRDHISVPTIPALKRARHHLNNHNSKITLIITGGLRVPADFIKAMALGADGIAIANSAIQSIGCVATRICHTNNCPTGIATQDAELRKRLDTTEAPKKLNNFLTSSVTLMQIMARACGHDRLNDFNKKDLSAYKKRNG